MGGHWSVGVNSGALIDLSPHTDWECVTSVTSVTSVTVVTSVTSVTSAT